MTLEASFTALETSLEHLAQILDNLLWAVVQGQPEAEQGHALVDHYEAATHDLLGLVKEAKKAAETSGKGMNGQLDLARTRQALITCQTRFNQLTAHFYGDLVPFEWIDALNSLAQERNDEWVYWVQGVRDALSQCPQLLYEVSQALLACWQDLTERFGLLSVSAQAISTGQEIRIVREGK